MATAPNPLRARRGNGAAPINKDEEIHAFLRLLSAGCFGMSIALASLRMAFKKKRMFTIRFKPKRRAEQTETT